MLQDISYGSAGATVGTDALPEWTRASVRTTINQAYASHDPKRARRRQLRDLALESILGAAGENLGEAWRARLGF